MNVHSDDHGGDQKHAVGEIHPRHARAGPMDVLRRTRSGRLPALGQRPANGFEPAPEFSRVPAHSKQHPLPGCPEEGAQNLGFDHHGQREQEHP